MSVDHLVDWSRPAPYLSGLAATPLWQRLLYQLDLILTERRAAAQRQDEARIRRHLQAAFRDLPLNLRRDIGIE